MADRIVTVYPVVHGDPPLVPVFLEGRLTVDGPGEQGPVVVWVRRA